MASGAEADSELAPAEGEAPGEVAPFADWREHLDLHLTRVGACLERYRYTADPTLRDAEGRRFAAARRIAEIDAELAARLAVSDALALPLEQLKLRFGLHDLPLRFLVAAAAPGLDLSLGRTIAGLHEDGRRQCEVGFLIELLTVEREEQQELLAALSETAPLARYRLLRLGAARGWTPEGPILLAPVAVPERILAWLRGETRFDGQRLHRSASLCAGADGATFDEGMEAMLDRALFRTAGEARLPTVLAGPSLSGKRTAVAFAAARRGRPVLAVDLQILGMAGERAEAIGEVVREACLQDAVLLLSHAECVLDERAAPLRDAVAAAMADGRLWVVLTTRGEPADLLRLAPGAQLMRLDMPTETEQLRLWTAALPDGIARADDLDPALMVRRYHLTPGDIREAVAAASGAAAHRGPGSPITAADMTEAVRGRLRHRLRDVADVVTTSHEWDDIILREEVLERIDELVSAFHYERLVMDEWGFGRRVAYGRALSALFSGPPGTGKTMIAGLIAKQLDLELFRVDLSRVVSKWVGETEKNLGLAFDEAKNARAILLFDEADSLFGKRTEVRSSNDRYANLETNYLLTRIESFDGIVLLTTNRDAQMDEAFRRRLRFRIVFPAPDEDEREQLWRSLIPPAAPLAEDVDFRGLAERFEMTGGYIKNAVVRAAYLAASSEDRLISQAILEKAATLEWEEMGKLA